jgi:PAS domain S-box-containing protein
MRWRKYVQELNVPDDLKIFIEGSPVALALALPDGDHPLALVNPRFSELTGYSHAELVGRNCRLLQRDADDRDARAKLRAFLEDDAAPSVRTPILNFKKDGTPFVNLLYMSRLRSLSGPTRFIFASQYDVSRAQPERLQDYDQALGQTLTRLTPIAAESGIIVEGTLTTIAHSATTIAHAKLTLADLDEGSML